jgi:hypothetical protein
MRAPIFRKNHKVGGLAASASGEGRVRARGLRKALAGRCRKRGFRKGTMKRPSAWWSDGAAEAAAGGGDCSSWNERQGGNVLSQPFIA